jgi:hypothetical protein
MRKRSSAVSEGFDELQPEYRFDFSKARPNPYAARLKGKAVAVVLDTEVAAGFPTSESVNSALRAVLVQRRSKGKRVARRRSNNQLQRTEAGASEEASPLNRGVGRVSGAHSRGATWCRLT